MEKSFIFVADFLHISLKKRLKLNAFYPNIKAGHLRCSLSMMSSSKISPEKEKGCCEITYMYPGDTSYLVFMHR